MIFNRAGIGLFSSMVIHSFLGAWLVLSAQTQLGQNSRVTVEISGIETTAPDTTSEKQSRAAPAPVTALTPIAQAHEADSSASFASHSAAANQAASLAASAPGLSSQVLNTYLSQIRDQISRAIHPPRVRLLTSLKSTLRLTLLQNGEVKNQEIEQSSGSPEFDHAILTALEKSRPFPPFTREMSEIHEVTVKLPIEIRPQ